MPQVDIQHLMTKVDNHTANTYCYEQNKLHSHLQSISLQIRKQLLTTERTFQLEKLKNIGGTEPTSKIYQDWTEIRSEYPKVSE